MCSTMTTGGGQGGHERTVERGGEAQPIPRMNLPWQACILHTFSHLSCLPTVIFLGVWCGWDAVLAWGWSEAEERGGRGELGQRGRWVGVPRGCRICVPIVYFMAPSLPRSLGPSLPPPTQPPTHYDCPPCRNVLVYSTPPWLADSLTRLPTYVLVSLVNEPRRHTCTCLCVCVCHRTHVFGPCAPSCLSACIVIFPFNTYKSPYCVLHSFIHGWPAGWMDGCVLPSLVAPRYVK